ncbi:NAD(P)/FAD-dependent oxidoreductase [Citricoccus sp.]|uniref:NAD(P)/FAD-dependent oxidoreductase n=1 Tax=Citricoccus sp. TaxID=1978372 RepID=UPI0028BEB7F3|nr:NAD(P)/FAD-dependent oxidoreductase [Citricoccus sp.]
MTSAHDTPAHDTPARDTSAAPDLDVLVAGGGAAGLAAAVTLARSRRAVTVVDSGQPRNAAAEGVHALLGREGISPAELLAAGRGEVAGYGGEVRSGEITAVRRLEDGRFETTVSTAEGETTLTARRLLIATGLTDELPDVPGLAEGWGRDVIHCPYCHGWEVRDRSILVLGTSPNSVHQALLFSQLSADVRFLEDTGRGPGLDADQARMLAARGVEVVTGEAAGVESGVRDGEDRLTGVRLSGGGLLSAEVVVVAPRMLARTEAFDSLGLRLEENPMGRFLSVDPAGRTSVPGVWAAGNASDLSAQVGAAAAAGTMAGAQLNAELVMEGL